MKYRIVKTAPYSYTCQVYYDDPPGDGIPYWCSLPKTTAVTAEVSKELLMLSLNPEVIEEFEL